MEQLTFNNQDEITLLDDLETGIRKIIEKVCQAQNVDAKYIKIINAEKTAKDKDTGIEIKEIIPDDLSVWICEPINFAHSDRVFHIKKKTLKTSKRFEIEFLYSRKDKFIAPDDAAEKIYSSKKVDENGETYYIHKISYWFPLDSPNIVKYLTNILEITLQGFTPKENFGCCSKYAECSDEKRCLHNNLFYARCCYYRKNLEAGRIFYGKNANC
ncbi:MAG: hypothetical protein NC120_03160 [Ruminococcus sp.]|nr:hypothetical protein [Ruminococcus sp.]